MKSASARPAAQALDRGGDGDEPPDVANLGTS
jgi:hypothetical protein